MRLRNVFVLKKRVSIYNASAKYVSRKIVAARYVDSISVQERRGKRKKIRKAKHFQTTGSAMDKIK
jgi:hypothetical protein